MRRRSHGNWIVTTIAAVLLLLVGTVIGQDLRLGFLSHAIGFHPAEIGLYVVTVGIGISTNVLGLLAAAVGLFLFRVL